MLHSYTEAQTAEKKPHRSASIPGIESKAALQLLTVGS